MVKRRGDWRTSDVKMNSKRLLLYLVITYSAWVLPRSRELAVRMVMFTTQLYPMPATHTSVHGQPTCWRRQSMPGPTQSDVLRFVRECLCAIHINRKLVTDSVPRSPLFPLVSSTLLIESILISPRRKSNWLHTTTQHRGTASTKHPRHHSTSSVAHDVRARANSACDTQGEATATGARQVTTACPRRTRTRSGNQSESRGPAIRSRLLYLLLPWWHRRTTETRCFC